MNLSAAQLNSGRDKQYYSPVRLTNKLGNNEDYDEEKFGLTDFLVVVSI